MPTREQLETAVGDARLGSCGCADTCGGCGRCVKHDGHSAWGSGWTGGSGTWYCADTACQALMDKVDPPRRWRP